MSEQKKTAKGCFARLTEHKRRTNKKAPHGKNARVCVVRSMSADPVAALLPSYLSRPHARPARRVDAAETDEVLPSGLRFSHHLRRRIVGRAMLFCFAVSLACVVAVALLSAVRVQHLTVSGHGVYTESEIRQLSGVRIGDELLSLREHEIASRLLAACPYLKDVDVKRGRDGVSIRLTECVPCYALLLEDGRIALMDETRYVADIVDAGKQPEALCVVTLPLPTVDGPTEDGEETVQLPQIPTEGDYIRGSNAELLLLDSIGQALGKVTLGCEAASIDITDRYAVTLTLTDGTVIELHSALQPARQLSLVEASLATYFATHPPMSETDRLSVDVDDSYRVSIRLVPKT